MAYKPALYTDGNKRITFKVDYCFTAEDLAVFWTSYNICEDGIPKPKSVRALMDAVRKEVRYYGEETPHYRVGDQGYKDAPEFDELVKHIEDLMGF